jgi:hypothetical protein
MCGFWKNEDMSDIRDGNGGVCQVSQCFDAQKRCEKAKIVKAWQALARIGKDKSGQMKKYFNSDGRGTSGFAAQG